jgi:hypothetical protein
MSILIHLNLYEMLNEFSNIELNAFYKLLTM